MKTRIAAVLGVAALVLGPVVARAQSILFNQTGPAGAAAVRVANAGDLDGDGAQDFLVGEPGPFFVPAQGTITVVSATKTVLATHVGPIGGGPLGTAVVSIGDQNGDGVPEYAGSAPTATVAGVGGAGVVQVFDGATRTLLGQIGGTTASERLGERLAALGDVDGDGFGDLAVSTNLQLIRVFSVAAFPATQIYQVGPPPGSGFLSNLSRVYAGGDYNLDGTNELMATNGIDAFVFDGTNGALMFSFFGPFFTNAAEAMADLGDVDADAISDFAVGDPTAQRVDVRSGANGSLLYSIFGTVPNRNFGSTIQSIGVDGDGDGANEFLVGEPGGALVAPVGGAVGLYSGASGTGLGGYFDPTGSLTDRFGQSLGVLDVNVDGIPEMLIGTGGLGSASTDAWVLSLFPYIAATANVGAPCSVVGGVATATLTAANTPIIGGGLVLNLAGATPGDFGILFVGSSLVGTPVPGTGCAAFVNPTGAVQVPFFADPAGAATFTVPVPDDMTFLFAGFTAQATAGAQLTQGVRLLVGAQ